jgi:hypothetical protein
MIDREPPQIILKAMSYKGITLADVSFLICGEGISLEDIEKLHLIWYPEHNTLVLVVLL